MRAQLASSMLLVLVETFSTQPGLGNRFQAHGQGHGERKWCYMDQQQQWQSHFQPGAAMPLATFPVVQDVHLSPAAGNGGSAQLRTCHIVSAELAFYSPPMFMR
jgi:hypothetical protein